MDGLTAIPGVAPQALISPSKVGRIRGAFITTIETLRLSFDALRAHKLRSFLTLLGVILAVTTLVAVMSVVDGMNAYVADRVANLGANVFIVDRFGIITSQDAWVKAQKRPLIVLEDYQRLRDNMRTAKAVAAEDDRRVQVRSGNVKMDDADVLGVTPNYADVRNINVAQGRFITEADDTHRSEVVFIGADIAKKFFPNVDPIGKTINAETHSYEVVGVAEAIGTAFGRSQDNFVIMPLGTYYKEWHRQTDWLGIFIQAPNGEMMQASEDEARMLMRAWRHLPYDAQDNFAILGSDSIMALWHDLT
jgi:putative ABC transport system permease protein